ncbi:MAG TPA: PRC-barrel domain-containing protein [Gammaproteobacteria bacterium]
MKRMFLLMTAFAPLIATASEEGSLQSRIDVQKLQQDVRATEVIGADVAMQGAEESGTVEDLEISADGRIQAVLIDGLDQQDASQQQEQGQQTQDQRVSATRGGSVGTQTDEGLTKVQWQQVEYDPQEQTVNLSASGQQGTGGSGSQSQQGSSMSGSASGSMGMGGMQTAGQAQSQQQAGGGDSFRASEIIGMEVHLSDAASFGEVEDVLIDRQQGKASALLVDAWEGFDKQTYALPVELNSVNREDDTLTYNYTESDVIALQEYEEQ